MTLILSRSAASHAAELQAARDTAAADLLAEVTAARLMYITVMPGQDAVYTAKEAEARQYLADPDPAPDLAGYPFLAAEIGITAQDATALAQLWVSMAYQWRQVAAQLEQIRLGGAAAIGAAPDLAGVAQALSDGRAAIAALAAL